MRVENSSVGKIKEVLRQAKDRFTPRMTMYLNHFFAGYPEWEPLEARGDIIYAKAVMKKVGPDVWEIERIMFNSRHVDRDHKWVSELRSRSPNVRISFSQTASIQRERFPRQFNN